MRVRVIVTDDQGKVHEGEVELTASSLRRSQQSRRPASKPVKKPTASPPSFVYTLNPRTFMNRYARNGSGPQKFTLLLACLSNGETSKEVSFDAIKSQWGRMSGLIGKFNPSYSIRAKDQGWVDTKKAGIYVLTHSWKEAGSRE